MKIAVVIGVFVVGLAYLSYKGWIDVKWVAMEDASRSTLTNASEQVVHVLNNTATQFAAHPSAVAASGLPIAGYVWICTRTTGGFQKGLEIEHSYEVHERGRAEQRDKERNTRYRYKLVIMPALKLKLSSIYQFYIGR
jgi:hypothetical protein